MALPSSYVEIQNDNNSLKTVFGLNDDRFKIIGKPISYCSQIKINPFKMYVIKVDNGCQFVGDFMHAGADNIIKFNEGQKKKYLKEYRFIIASLSSIEELKTIIKKLINCDKKKEQYTVKIKELQLQFIENLKNMGDIRQSARFFCKTKPNHFHPNYTNLNIYTMPEDKCEYKNYIKKNELAK